MQEQGPHRCATCPAFEEIPGESEVGTCHSMPPVALQGEASFRGPTRELPFGAFPVVGAFPLVRAGDFCMAHPKNRHLTMR
jgi:hypothetical protein